ncbi:uncharacterized protein LOC133325977 [Musca vetustissima]|uniref:uncharacterized protein LOC133325977 n=1 Tax=Musca vetustissima TaxID=27455 RepID=UPI002AB7DCA0|nr:uncharacterized protein LOC133325977 [Musca vetustissima]
MENLNAAEDNPSINISLPDKLESKMNQAFSVDCQFIVGENLGKPKTIFGHKLIFALNSEVFESMFSGNFMEAKFTRIPLPDDDPNAFRNLRIILYNLRDASQEVEELNVSDTISLYKLCDKYMFTTIAKLCREHLKKLIEKSNHDDALKIFDATVAFSNLKLLEPIKTKLLANDYSTSLPTLYELDYVSFMKYIELKIECNLSNHMPIFDAIEKYILDNNLIPQQLRATDKSTKKIGRTTATTFGQEDVVLLSDERSMELMEKLLSYVDFAKITIEDFISGPGTSNILTWKQKYTLLSELNAVDLCGFC